VKIFNRSNPVNPKPTGPCAGGLWLHGPGDDEAADLYHSTGGQPGGVRRPAVIQPARLGVSVLGDSPPFG